VKLTITVLCSGPECTTKQALNESTVLGKGLPTGWSKLSIYAGNGTVHTEAFCHTDCAMKWCAAQHPLEKMG